MGNRDEVGYSQGVERAKEEARQDDYELKKWQRLENSLIESFEDRRAMDRLFQPHYLVDGALLTCTSCTLEPVKGMDKMFSAPPKSNYRTLKVTQNTFYRAHGQLFATVKDCQKFDNITPFGNCNNRPDRDYEEKKIREVEEGNPAQLSEGTCKHLMNLNLEWENLKAYGGYIDDNGEEIEEITMEAVLFCQHGGFIYPLSSGLVMTVGESEDINDADIQTKKEYIWNCLIEDFDLTPMYAAAIMGNIQQESLFSPTNAQESYGYIDMENPEYIAMYNANDGVGWGLIQWTYHSRKSGLLDYANRRGTSVGDMDTQLEYLKYELFEGPYADQFEEFLKQPDLILGYRIFL